MKRNSPEASNRKISHIAFTVMLIALPVITIIVSLGIGAYPIKPSTILNILWEQLLHKPSSVDDLTVNVLMQSRLPRIMTAAVVGAGLSISGGVFQSLFHNPLASPYTLGISNGAGLGAAIGILLSLSIWGTQVLAIICGILAIFITLLLATKRSGENVTLILSGMLISALLSSLLSLMKFVADPFDKLPQIIYWLMGTFNGVSYNKILFILPGFFLSYLVIYAYRWRINLLSLGDTEAQSYGVPVRKDRLILLGISGAMTSLCVSVSGIIGWVGIVVPHFARMIVGPDFRKILSASISFGITYLVIIDDICRSVSSQEIPLGVVTGIIGAPLFIYFMYRRKHQWV